MALDASILQIRVQSDGIADATKGLNDLAKAGEAAEQKTSNIGKGAAQASAATSKAAQDSAKAVVDAAQQAASAYNATIDQMTVAAQKYYNDAATRQQQELFDGMSMMDKLYAHGASVAAQEAADRAKASEDIRAQQQKILDAAMARYAAEQELANRMNAAYDKKTDAAAQAAAMKQEQAEWKALAKAADEYYASEKKLADEADKWHAKQSKAMEIADANKLADANKALAAETAKLNAQYAQEQATANSMNKEATAFLDSLKRQADTVGMTTKQIREYNMELLRTQAAEMGVSKAAEEHINKLKNAKGPHESFNLLTAGSARELMVLGHELSQGNFQRFGGSLIVLGERINFLPSLLEKASAFAGSLGVSLGVLVAAVAAVVAVTAGAVITWYKSVAALHEMNAAVIMTGNSAGATGDQLYEMSNRIGESFGQFKKAREAVLSLAETGRFTAEEIDKIAVAAVGLEKYAGVSIEKTVQQFERLAAEPLKAADKGFKGVSDAAMQLDQQLHFLDPTVLAQIMHMESIGDAAGASKVAISALAEEETRRAEELKKNLTPMGKMLEEIGEKASRMWNNLFHTESKGETLTRMQAALREFDDHPIWTMLDTGMTSEQADKMRQEVKKLSNEILQDNYDAAEKAHNKRMDQETNLAMVQLRNIALRAKGEENLAQATARYEKSLQEARDRAAEDPKFAATAAQFISPEAEKEALAYIQRTHALKQAKPRTEGLSGLDTTLAQLSEQYDVEKRVMDNRIKLIDFEHQHKMITDEDAQQQKESILDKEMVAQKDYLDKAIAAIDAFHTKDLRLANDAATKRANLEKQRREVMLNINLKGEENDMAPEIRVQADALKQQKAQDEVMKTVERQTKAVQDQVDAYNRLPEAVKAAGISQKQMASEVEQSKINDLLAEQADLLKNDSAQNTVRLFQIDREIAARTKLLNLDKDREKQIAANDAALNRSSALTRIATEQVKIWKDAGNEIERSLKNAFGSAGEAAGKMFKAFAEGQASQIDMLDKVRKVSESKSLSEVEKTQQINDLQLQGAQAQLGSYGQMADAASTYFEKGSTGYQAMVKAAQVLHTAEVALSVIKGVNAILTQGSGDPYSAFARMAAMAAIVAGLGVAISGSFGGGGAKMSAENQQKIQGTGTVLGSPTITDGIDVKLVGAKSDSIANSLKLAEKNSGLGLVVQNDMLTQLQTLNNNISNFAAMVVQNSGLTGITAQTTKGGAYDFGNSTLGVALTGGLFGVLLNKITGGLVGKITGSILGSIFGGKTTVDDTGLSIGKETIGQVSSSGLVGNQYTNTTTSGGWFSSDKHNTATQSLGSEFNDQITKVVLSMQDTLKLAAKGLGVDGQAFNDKLASFVVDIGNVSLKGMTGDQITQTLNNIFSKLGDQMANYAFGDLQKYQKVGEGLMETVVRVANDLQQVNDVFAVLGKTIPQALDGIATSEALISQFGTVDNLTKGVKSYVSSIYSDEEKLAYTAKSVTDSMNALGYSAVKTKEQFKALVDSLDLTKTVDQELFAKLMNIAPQFGQMIDDTTKAATDARSALTDAYKRESDAIKQTQDKMKSLVTTLKQLGSDSLLGDLSPLTPQQKYLEAKSQFETIAAKAQSGDETAQGQFATAYNAFLSASKVANASGDQYVKDFEYAQKVTQEATSWAQRQVDVAQATLDALNKQVAGLIDVNEGLLTVSQAINNLVKVLGDAGKAQATNNAQNAIESLYNNILGRKSDQAGMDFYKNAVANGTSISDVANSMANSNEAKIDLLYKQMFNRAPDQAGLDFWVKQVNNGVSLSDVQAAFAGSAEAGGSVSPATSVAPVTSIAPVTPIVSSGSMYGSSANVAQAIGEMQNAVTTAITESGQQTTTAVTNLISATIDSQDAAAEKITDGVSEAVQSSRSTTFAIQQR